MLSSTVKKITFTLVGIAIFLLAACSPTAPEPPPTLQAVVDGSAMLDTVDLGEVEVLQERPFGTGQLMLYEWTNEAEATCLAATYLTTINGQWQIHDTAAAGCQTEQEFVAAYTGNSEIVAPFGLPRHTTVYGTSQYGHAVRIVWADGQVNHVPLNNGAFVEARTGKWDVERIELLDDYNNLLLTEMFKSVPNLSN